MRIIQKINKKMKIESFEKAIKVIESCKTLSELVSAIEYYKNYRKMYGVDLVEQTSIISILLFKKSDIILSDETKFMKDFVNEKKPSNFKY